MDIIALAAIFVVLQSTVAPRSILHCDSNAVGDSSSNRNDCDDFYRESLLRSTPTVDRPFSSNTDRNKEEIFKALHPGEDNGDYDIPRKVPRSIIIRPNEALGFSGRLKQQKDLREVFGCFKLKPN
ncbi:hypothetical protein ACOME3_002867 [Neoechinorhynchus agilis]